jgi:bidirectional [NiFe] hydrogenase diaphorase subunit
MPSDNGHPSGDDRYLAIDESMDRFGRKADALLEVLNTAQETFGYLSEDLLIYISYQLAVPLSRLYGVATFYHLFTFEPLGLHNATLCTGTACHVKGSAKIVASVAEAFSLEPGSTSEDGLFSLNTARCLGCCGLAPVMVLDGEIYGKQTPAAALERVMGVLAEETTAALKDQEAG